MSALDWRRARVDVSLRLRSRMKLIVAMVTPPIARHDQRAKAKRFRSRHHGLRHKP